MPFLSAPTVFIEHQPTLYGVDPPKLLGVDVTAASPEFVEEFEDVVVASPELGEAVSVPELDSALDTDAPSVGRTVAAVLVTVDPAVGGSGPDTEVDVEGENVVSPSPVTIVGFALVVLYCTVEVLVEDEDDNDEVSGHCSAVTLPSSSPCSMKQNSSPFLV